ncbi:hypothetical protein J6590_090621, partial [Homalodisca vitripennis]
MGPQRLFKCRAIVFADFRCIQETDQRDMRCTLITRCLHEPSGLQYMIIHSVPLHSDSVMLAVVSDME